MMTSTQSWLHCALWLLCGGVLTSSAVIVVKTRLREDLTSAPLGKPEWKWKWKRAFLVITGERFSRVTSSAFLLVLGVVVGRGWGAVAQARMQVAYEQREVDRLEAEKQNIVPLAQVWIAARQAQDKYLVCLPHVGCETIKFCPERIPELTVHSRLLQLVYQQKPECASISTSNSKLGFTVDRDDHGDPIIYDEPGVLYVSQQARK